MATKYNNLKATDKEVDAIKEAGDYFAACSGGVGEDAQKAYNRMIKAIDKLLKRNGYKRDFN